MFQHSKTNSNKPTRVVILGANGFVGRYATAALQANGVATVGTSSADLDLTASDAPDRLSSLITADDVVLFISALCPDRGRDLATLHANVKMAEHFSSWIQNSDAACAHVVYISSDAVYMPGVELLREETPADPAPGNLHGIMHITREKIIATACSQKDIPLLRLRPTIVFGAGDTHNGYGPNRYLRQAKAGETITLFGQGEEKRDHLYVEDLAAVIRDSILRGTTGVLNVASGISTSFMEAAQAVKTIAEASGAPVTIEGSERGNPITHLHFDTTELLKAFPGLSFTGVRKGLEATWNAS